MTGSKLGYATEELKYETFNFHRLENRHQLSNIFNNLENRIERVVLLIGELGSGRQYFVESVLYQMQRKDIYFLPITLSEKPATGIDHAFLINQFEKLEPEKKGLLEFLRKLLNSQEAEIQLPGLDFLFGVSLALCSNLPFKILAEILKNLSRRLTGPTRPAYEAFWFMLEDLRKHGLIILFLPELNVMSEGLKNSFVDYLRQSSLPHVVLMACCTQKDKAFQKKFIHKCQNYDLITEFDFSPLNKNEIRKILDDKFSNNDFSERFVNTLFRYSSGYPRYLAIKIKDLLDRDLLIENNNHTWHVLEHDQSYVQVMTPFVQEKIYEFEKSLKRTKAKQLREFLDFAALCGKYVPVRLILQAMNVEDKDGFIKLIDNQLLESDKELFKDLGYNFAPFNDNLIYEFSDPLYRAVLYNLLNDAIKGELAARLLPELENGLPINSKECGNFFCNIASYLSDTSKKDYYQSLVAWWVDQYDLEIIQQELIQEIKKNDRLVTIIWQVVENTQGIWPPFLRLALLEVLPHQKDGLSEEVRIYYCRLRAELLFELARFDECIETSEHALSGIGREEVLKGLFFTLIGLSYEGKGNLSRAYPYLRDALIIAEQYLNSKHPSVAASLNNLAGLLKAQGKYAESEPLYRRSLEIYEQQLGPEYPAVATSLNNLAELLRAQGSMPRPSRFIAAA